MKVYGNTISNVNFGICVIGPLAAADQNNGIDIGGTSAGQGNSITNWGTTSTFSGDVNVSGTMNGILIRNSYNVNVSYNTLTSSNGGITVGGTVTGINLIAYTVASTTTSTNTINNNAIAVTPGVTGTLNGIIVSGTSFISGSSLSISNNNFTALNHTVAATGSITAISSAAAITTTNINSNTFTNLSTSTTGSFTFISNSITVVAGGTQNINSNSIVTAFNKTGAGGTVTGITTGGSSTTGTFSWSSNNFSNMTVTGATAITFIIIPMVVQLTTIFRIIHLAASLVVQAQSLVSTQALVVLKVEMAIWLAEILLQVLPAAEPLPVSLLVLQELLQQS
ncbi:MAG: hypothetical protein IPP51_00945 [Bacteroidetes bacterium]|nr:hypothetical protein [Bacteroidota bacterium]